jgi:hypothetical protein
MEGDAGPHRRRRVAVAAAIATTALVVSAALGSGNGPSSSSSSSSASIEQDASARAVRGKGQPATRMDPADSDVPAQLDIRSLALWKRDGRMFARIELRGPVTDNALYLVDMAVGISFSRLYARRVHGENRFSGVRDGQPIAGAHGRIHGRTVTINAPLDALLGPLRYAVRMRAYTVTHGAGLRWAEGDTTYTGGTWFCFSTRKPRPTLGPCLWPT